MSARSLTSVARLSALFRREFSQRLSTKAWVASANVRPPTYGALIVIDERGGISQKELADALGLHPSDVVDLVDLLERNGWVTRDRDPADRRRYHLTLTASGRTALGRFDRVAQAAEDAVLRALTADERASLDALVGKVLAAHEADRAAIDLSSTRS